MHKKTGLVLAQFALMLMIGTCFAMPVFAKAQEDDKKSEEDGTKKSDNKKDDKEKKQIARPPNEGAPKVSETGGLNGQKVYVSIGPIILPVITAAGPQQIITMVVSLQVKNSDDSDKVRKQFPRLVDAYMRALYGKLDQHTLINGVLLDIDYVKRKLSKATNETMKDSEIVEDVLIQAVAQRQV